MYMYKKFAATATNDVGVMSGMYGIGT